MMEHLFNVFLEESRSFLYWRMFEGRQKRKSNELRRETLEFSQVQLDLYTHKQKNEVVLKETVVLHVKSW